MSVSKSGWTRRGAAALGLSAAASACAKAPESPPYEGAVSFAHGVASGDPTHEAVVIWTRVSPERAGPVPVRWVLARNRKLTDVVKTGVFETGSERDYTVKIDVTGLRSNAPYFFGFIAGGQTSTIGKTRTLAHGRQADLKLGIVSCASFPHGFFNAYDALSKVDGVDVVLHLGDYIYEYGLSGYGGESAIALGRIPSPEIECTDLDDYRQRHAQAKTQTELQAAHAMCPWIVVWDDHEIANDCWTGGAENHNPPREGDWGARKAAAIQAYYEWMPIRDPVAGAAFAAINRSFHFGDLASVIMLETRLLQRTKPFDYATEMPIRMRVWDFSNPAAPLPVNTPTGAPSERILPAPFEEIDGQAREVSDWIRVAPLMADTTHLPPGFFFMPDEERLNAALSAPERMMMGATQQRWLERELAQSAEARPWQIIGNQVLMAKVATPDLSDLPEPALEALEQVRPGARQLVNFTRAPIPLNTDAWDGYPAARAAALRAMRNAAGNVIVVTGDTHAAWANELEDEEGRVAVELGTTSITSPNDAEVFSRMGVDFGAALQPRNPHIKWTDQNNRGFLILSLTKDEAKAEFFTVSTVASTEYETARAASFTIAPQAGQGIGALTSEGET